MRRFGNALIVAGLVASAAPMVLAQQGTFQVTAEEAQTLAELEAISAQCGSNPTQAEALRARYLRFYSQLKDEHAGLQRLLQSTSDPALRNVYSERIIALGMRLDALPTPDRLGCKENDAENKTEAGSDNSSGPAVEYKPEPDSGICWSKVKIEFAPGSALDFGDLPAKTCPPEESDRDLGQPVESVRETVLGGLSETSTTQALAELEAISSQCAANPADVTSLDARYRRFYTQVEREIFGLEKLAQSASDPALKKDYADRAEALEQRLAPLPRPDQLGCGPEDLQALKDAVARRLLTDPIAGTWNVLVERIRGEPSEGRVAFWPVAETRCVSKLGDSCIYRWVVKPEKDYFVEGSATHMPYGIGGNTQAIRQDMTVLLRHRYFPNTEVTEQLLVSPSQMTGVWQTNDDLQGRSTWTKLRPRLTAIGLSDITRDFTPTETLRFDAGAPMEVEGEYDAFFWSAEVTARLPRPKLIIFLYGENLDGGHYIEFPKARGFDPEGSQPLVENGKVIGAKVFVTLRPDATPGRKLMLIDGMDYWINIHIEGFPGKPQHD